MEFEHVFEPQAVNLGVYDERYGTFLEVHRRMRLLCRRIRRGAPPASGAGSAGRA